jgi:hypothetical protein
MSKIDNCSDTKETIYPTLYEEDKSLSLVSAGDTMDKELVEILFLQSDEKKQVMIKCGKALLEGN